MSEIDEIRRLLTTYQSPDRFEPGEFGKMLVGQLSPVLLAGLSKRPAARPAAPRARETSTPEWPGLGADLFLDDVERKPMASDQPDADDCATDLQTEPGYARVHVDYSAGGFAGRAWYVSWSAVVARHPGVGTTYQGECVARDSLESALARAAEVITDVDRDTSPTDGVGPGVTVYSPQVTVDVASVMAVMRIEVSDTAANLATPLGWPAVGAVAYRDGWAACRFAHGLALVDSPVGVWVDVADAIWDAALSFPQDSDCDDAPAGLLPGP